MKWLKQIWDWLMSRLMDTRNKLQKEAQLEFAAKQKEEAVVFQTFYHTAYYTIFKAGLEARLHELDRKQMTDPSTLILLQGERNALIGILDELQKKERAANVALSK